MTLVISVPPTFDCLKLESRSENLTGIILKRVNQLSVSAASFETFSQNSATTEAEEKRRTYVILNILEYF
jgi:hypothetical protein